MATVKKTPASSAAAKPALPVFPVPDGLSKEEDDLLEKASAEIDRVEQRIMAMCRAASKRWRPNQSVLNTDETDEPVFGDDEYADFLAVVETMGEAATFKTIGMWMGVPEATLDEVVKDRLKTTFFGAPPNKRGQGHVALKQQRRENE